MGGSMAQRLPAAFTELELFSNSHRHQLENGISGRSIPFTDNRTEVSLTVRCFALPQENFMGPLTTVVETVSALFTNCLRGPLANGVKESFTAFKTEPTATVRSAILFPMRPAIFMELRVKAG